MKPSSNADKKTYKAVVIGTGNMGALWEGDALRPKPATHAGVYAGLENTGLVTLVALVDTKPENLEQAHKLFPNAKTYADAKECLENEKPDIVSIATPAGSHESILEICAEAGIKTIICEKPLSDDLKSAERMNALANTNGMTVIVNHQRRFFELFNEVRDKIASGEFGKIQQASAYYSNGLINNGSHSIDALQYILSDDVVGVTGFLNEYNKTHGQYDSNIDGMLFFKKGTVATIQSLDNAKFGIHDFVLFAEKAMIKISDYGYRLEITPALPSKNFAQISQLDIEKAHVRHTRSSMVSGAIHHALACLSGAEQPKGTIADALITMKVIDALKSSADEKGKFTKVI